MQGTHDNSKTAWRTFKKTLSQGPDSRSTSEVSDVSLSRIAHGETFKKRRRKLPGLDAYFRGEHGGPGLNTGRFRFAVKGLLSLRESPVSGEGFKLWLAAHLQRRQGYATESSLPWVAARSAPFPGDVDDLIRRSVVFSPGNYLNDLRRYRAAFARGGADGLLAQSDLSLRRRRAQGTPGPLASRVWDMNAYAVIFLHDVLQRRYRYIYDEGKRDLARDCARLAAVDAHYTTKPLMRVDFSADTYDRMAVDIKRMAQGAAEQDWSFMRTVEPHARLTAGGAFASADVALDLVVNGDTLIEVKPFRHVAAGGSADQMVAHALLYWMEHPDVDLRELRFYMARHAAFASVSFATLQREYPLRDFGELLFVSEQDDVDRLLGESLDDFVAAQRNVASVRAWEMTDQLVSIGRRSERAGRIGVTEIAELREVPHVLEFSLSRPEDAGLPARMQRLLEAIRLDEVWETMYEERRAALLVQRRELQSARAVWDEFAARRNAGLGRSTHAALSLALPHDGSASAVARGARVASGAAGAVAMEEGPEGARDVAGAQDAEGGGPEGALDGSRQGLQRQRG